MGSRTGRNEGLLRLAFSKYGAQPATGLHHCITMGKENGKEDKKFKVKTERPWMTGGSLSTDLKLK